MASMLIKGGTVVDGSGAPAFAADVRIAGGAITEVGPNLSANGEDVFDAAGCLVTPGFIESHTHYDAAMWWQPDLDPLPGFGATTMILGNCGFTAAPLSNEEAARLEMVKIFSFFEDIPLDTFLSKLPWDWRSWPEYKASVLEKVRVPVNHATFVGHIAIRLAAMGMDAWTRVATPDEIAEMAKLLDQALASGALGMSDNMLDHDGDNRPIPTLVADDAEINALLDVLQRYPAATYQVIVDAHMRRTAPQQMDRLHGLLKGRGIRVQIAGAQPLLSYQAELLPILTEKLEAMRADGIDAWPGYAHVPPTVAVGLYKSLLFAQSNDYVWHEVVLEQDFARKEALLRDPEWRARARESQDTQAWTWSPFRNPQKLILDNSDNGHGPVGITLEEYATSRGQHRSDAMADWFLDNGLLSTLMLEPFPLDQEVLVKLLRAPNSVGNISDAGAHLQMLCGAGENMLLFTKFVPEGKITLEEAVHVQTGKLARFFGLADRGVIAPGMRADIAVFSLDEIAYRPRVKKVDLPDGKGGTTWRFSRDAAPMRLTLVNGVATFADGKFTGAMPGDYLEPSVAEAAPALMAAE